MSNVNSETLAKKPLKDRDGILYPQLSDALAVVRTLQRGRVDEIVLLSANFVNIYIVRPPLPLSFRERLGRCTSKFSLG
jgi:hypothetical protein